MMHTILWVDDEIDLLKPYTIFLGQKGYEVSTASNGHDAIDMCKKFQYDIIFLDENMPGIDGLETLNEIKKIRPTIPVVMITKSEEENIMDMAIGNQIADYLIKPVNPNQILMTLKKNIHKHKIEQEQTTSSYRGEFANISMEISDKLNPEEWTQLYRKLTDWDIKLDGSHSEMHEMLRMQKNEANAAFTRFIKYNYESWFQEDAEHPMLSPDLFKKRVFPLLDAGEQVFVVIIDNFRYDQWRVIQETMRELFTIENDELYFSILPTATQYARNAICAGLMPLQIKEMFPNLWVEEGEEEGKNLYEAELIQTQLDRYRKKYEFSYTKINNSNEGQKLVSQIPQLMRNPLNVCVLNFVDMLSHARTESKMIRELANSESAFRSLAKSWFKHSSTYDLFKELSKRNIKVIVTTDHGTVHVNKAIKVVGDKNTNTNLKYKVGRSLTYNKREVYEIHHPKNVLLPSPNLSSSYIFATGNDFFAYPNNYNYYVSYYKDTFQHGGISMEEMMIPIITMTGKQQ